MSPDLALIENVWQLLKIKIRQKKIDNLLIVDLRNTAGMEVFDNELGHYTCT